MKMRLLKRPDGLYQAYDAESQLSARRHRSGAIVEADVVQPRNWRYHKKYFALLKLGFDYWEPDLEYQGRPVAKDFDRFRKDVAILAGHYNRVWNILGELRLEPRSISFASMSPEEFDELYSKTVQVLIDKVLETKGFTPEQVDRAVNEILRFDD